MWKKLLNLFKSKTPEYSEDMNAATAEFDALMVTVENDETDLATLERHMRQQFDDIHEDVKEDCNQVDRVVN